MRPTHRAAPAHHIRRAYSDDRRHTELAARVCTAIHTLRSQELDPQNTHTPRCHRAHRLSSRARSRAHASLVHHAATHERAAKAPATARAHAAHAPTTGDNSSTTNAATQLHVAPLSRTSHTPTPEVLCPTHPTVSPPMPCRPPPRPAASLREGEPRWSRHSNQSPTARLCWAPGRASPTEPRLHAPHLLAYLHTSQRTAGARARRARLLRRSTEHTGARSITMGGSRPASPRVRGLGARTLR